MPPRRTMGTADYIQRRVAVRNRRVFARSRSDRSQSSHESIGPQSLPSLCQCWTTRASRS